MDSGGRDVGSGRASRREGSIESQLSRRRGTTDSLGRVTRLLDGTLGHHGYKAFRFFKFLARQLIQVLKILLLESEEVSFRKEERTCS